MGQALYRKYRSKSLIEIIGQEHVTTTLTNAIKTGKISHAYLLSGPRGVGKTSIARILAHDINELSYDDEAHFDIIEIDAASNRRIDEIRELRERVNTAPAHTKYKVYIIDEVHMLTKEAFNALLKTLEEPPAHAVFILATTEAHKLPKTIVSRTQHYSLRPVPQKQVIAHLQQIATGEKIDIEDAALSLIAEHGEGSFRDSISLLDQVSSTSDHVSKKDVEHVLGLAPDEYIARLISAIEKGQFNSVVITLNELYDQGFEPAMIATQLSSVIRDTILANKSIKPQANLRLLERLLDVPAARSPKQLLELILLQHTTPQADPVEVSITPILEEPVKLINPSKMLKEDIAKEPAPEPSLQKETPSIPVTDTSDKVFVNADELWQQTLQEIKKQYNTLYGIARMANIEFDGSTLTLAFKFAFHQKRVNEAKNRKIFSDVVERLHGKPVEIICIVAEPILAETPKPDVSAISTIFGGAELLES